MLHPSGFPGRIHWGRMQLSIWKFSMTQKPKPAVCTETPSPSRPFDFHKAIGMRGDGWGLILPLSWSSSKTAIKNLKPSGMWEKEEHKPSCLLFVKAAIWQMHVLHIHWRKGYQIHVQHQMSFNPFLSSLDALPRATAPFNSLIYQFLTVVPSGERTCECGKHKDVGLCIAV